MHSETDTTNALVDPVCGMAVTPQSQYHVNHDSSDYYFCSQGCEHKFNASPGSYLKPMPHQDSGDVASGIYTCPMHPEVEQQGQGSCPKCGMALELKGLPVVETKTEYTCPMHPEIIQDHPGSCPKCGMALEAKTIAVEEKNEELIDMSRRFWVSAVLAFPVFVLAMIADLAPS